MQLSLGPVLYNWAADEWRDFYFRIADEAAVDTVIVGETVCSKRAPFFAPHLPAVIERLAGAGKQVLLSSLIMPTTPRERRLTDELCGVTEFLTEANDLTSLKRLAGRPHAIGPYVNTYNEATASFFVRRGASRICLPPELPLSSVEVIATAVPEAVVEIFGFGKIPLAISSRCYHARVRGLSKDNCQFVCADDADGLAVQTLDDQDFLTINGVQTLSSSCTNVLVDVAALREVGVKSLRLSPQACDMVAVVQVFRNVLDGRDDSDTGNRLLAQLYPQASFANGFLHEMAGAAYVVAQAVLP